MTQQKQHYVWLDYMKVYGLYFIVLGHFFPTYSSYIYAFNVPLFFVVSGILSKKEDKFETFINKSMHNLIIPVCIIMVIQYIWDITMHSDMYFDVKSLRRFANAIIGMHGIYCGGGLGTCWFIYTLFVLKLLYQTFSKRILLVLLFLLPITAVLLIKNGIAPGNSILNVTVAYPFFWFGNALRSRLGLLNNIKLMSRTTYITTCICFIVLLFVGKYNWKVWIHLNAYGRYLLLYIIGGLTGTYVVYVISILSERYWGASRFLNVLSVGSIVILGFHYGIIIDLIYLCNLNVNDYNAIFYSFAIMMLFIPINMFFEKYCPMIFGKRLQRL